MRRFGVALALFFASAATAQQPPSPAPPAPIPTVAATLDTTATSVGGRLRVTLTVDAPEGWSVEPPAPPEELGAFRVRSVEPGVDAQGRPAFGVVVVPVQPNALEIRRTMRVRRSAEEPIELASPPLAVLSRRISLGGRARPCRSHQDLKRARGAARWRPVWIAALAMLAAFALAFALPPAPPPGAQAAPVIEPRAPARPA
jgi:hypothetical protein